MDLTLLLACGVVEGTPGPTGTVLTRGPAGVGAGPGGRGPAARARGSRSGVPTDRAQSCAQRLGVAREVQPQARIGVEDEQSEFIGGRADGGAARQRAV